MNKFYLLHQICYDKLLIQSYKLSPDLSNDLTTKYSYSWYSTFPSWFTSHSFIQVWTSYLLGVYPSLPSTAYVSVSKLGTSASVTVYSTGSAYCMNTWPT